MSTWLVPKERWSSFCTVFSREHVGGPVDVTVVQTRELDRGGRYSEPTGEVLAANCLLQEIRESPRGSVRDVLVTVRDEADATSFLAQDVIRLVEDPPSVLGSGLRIDTREGVTALLFLHKATA